MNLGDKIFLTTILAQ